MSGDIKMPRSLLTKNISRALAASLALAVLVLFAGGLHAGAQKRRRPAPKQSPPTAAAATTTTSATQQQQKNITPLRVSDTAEGSRVTITSDVPLNDYSAYRSGDRFFLVIPGADAPRLLSALQRGRGFEDVQVQKRGNDVVLSFRLQPGVTARVNQKFNRLEILFTVPARSTTTAGQTRTDITPANTNNSNTAGTGTQTVSPTTPSNENAAEATAGTGSSGTRAGRRYPRTGGTSYTESYPDIPPASEGTAPSATESVVPSPTASPAVSPSATPAEQIAQSQPAPTAPTTTTTNAPPQAAPGSWVKYHSVAGRGRRGPRAGVW